MQKISDALAWAKKNHAFLAWLYSAAISTVALVLFLTGKTDVPPPLPPPPPPIQSEPPVTYAFGWHEDRAEVERIATEMGAPEFAQTAAGQAVMGDADHAYLWKALEQVWADSKYNVTHSRFPNVDQKSVGCCVGAATKHTQDHLAAVQMVLQGQHAEWRPFAGEPPYANSRVVVLKSQIRGDGSTGAAAAQSVSQLGNLSMDKFGSVDLTTFDPMRMRAWGNTGVPKDLVAECAKWKTVSVARVRSWSDVRKSLDNGYPVLLTSNVGFEGRKDRVGHLVRDQDGFLAQGGVWPHAMCCIGYRTSSREGGCILNSWGDEINVGPVGDGNAPLASFWADAAVINKMCASGDCWAFSGFVGFPSRRLKWNTQTQPLGLDRFRSFRLAAIEARNPEVSLAW